LQVLIAEPIRNGHIFVIPAILSGLLSTDRQNCATARIEGMEPTVRSAGMLNSRFPHITVPRARDAAGMRKRKPWAKIAPQLKAPGNK
jgi:hypothetical protein